VTIFATKEEYIEKNKQYHTVGTVPDFNRYNLEYMHNLKDTINTPTVSSN